MRQMPGPLYGRLRYSQNDVAVVLAGTAYRLKPVDNRPLLNWYGDTGHLMASLTPVCSELGQRRSASIDSSPSRGAVDSHHPTRGRNARIAQLAEIRRRLGE